MKLLNIFFTMQQLTSFFCPPACFLDVGFCLMFPKTLMFNIINFHVLEIKLLNVIFSSLKLSKKMNY